MTNKFDWYPSKDSLYGFIANLILLIIALVIGNLYITAKLNTISADRIEKQSISDKKDQFVADFTKLGQRRIYLGENFFFNVVSDSPTETATNAWTNYFDSVTAWNSQNLFNPIFIEYYFGQEMRGRFENQLSPKLVDFHEMLEEMHRGRYPADIARSKAIIEAAKNEMFRFAEDLIKQK